MAKCHPSDLRKVYDIAQEYFAAAEAQENETAKFALISAGVASLEAILSQIARNHSTTALKLTISKIEIVSRHRLAQVLLLYTQNYIYAEKVLNKGILLASRTGLDDLQLELQLLMVSLLSKMGHKSVGYSLINASLKSFGAKSNLSDEYSGKQHAVQGYLLLKVLTDPGSSSAEFSQLNDPNAGISEDVQFVTSILEALWNMQSLGNYQSALKIVDQRPPKPDAPLELEVLWLQTAITAQLGCGRLDKSKNLVSRLHKVLDGIDWSKWRQCLPLDIGSSESLYISCQSQTDTMFNTYLLSGIYYLYKGKISLSIRFFTQGQNLTKTNTQHTTVLSFYLTFAYFTSCQWNNGYQTMLTILPVLPKRLNKYICGVYLQAIGKLNAATKSYRQVTDNCLGGDDELATLANINLSSIERIRPQLNEQDVHDIQLSTCLKVFLHEDAEFSSGVGADTFQLDNINIQLRAMVLCLLGQNTSGSNQHKKLAVAKEAYSEALRIKNWLWAWMAGSLLHQVLVESGKAVAAEAQAAANQSLHDNLSKLYGGSLQR